MACVAGGARIGFYAGDPQLMLKEDMPMLKPTVMSAVPRIYSRISGNYVCVCICMCVCMYVCMYSSLLSCLPSLGYTAAFPVIMYVYMYVFVYVCMYVLTQAYCHVCRP